MRNESNNRDINARLMVETALATDPTNHKKCIADDKKDFFRLPKKIQTSELAYHFNCQNLCTSLEKGKYHKHMVSVFKSKWPSFEEAKLFNMQKEFCNYLAIQFINQENIKAVVSVYRKNKFEVEELLWNEFNAFIFKDEKNEAKILIIIKALINAETFIVNKDPMSNYLIGKTVKNIVAELGNKIKEMCNEDEISIDKLRMINNYIYIIFDNRVKNKNPSNNEIENCLMNALETVKVDENDDINVLLEKRKKLQEISLQVNEHPNIFGALFSKIRDKGIVIQNILEPFAQKSVKQFNNNLNNNKNLYASERYISRISLSNFIVEPLLTISPMPGIMENFGPKVSLITTKLFVIEQSSKHLLASNFNETIFYFVAEDCSIIWNNIFPLLTSTQIWIIYSSYAMKLKFISEYLCIEDCVDNVIYKLMREIYLLLDSGNDVKNSITLMHLVIDALENVLDFEISSWNKSIDKKSDREFLNGNRNWCINKMLHTDSRTYDDDALLSTLTLRYIYDALYERTYLNGLEIRNSIAHCDENFLVNIKRYNSFLLMFLMSIIDEMVGRIEFIKQRNALYKTLGLEN